MNIVILMSSSRFCTMQSLAPIRELLLRSTNTCRRQTCLLSHSSYAMRPLKGKEMRGKLDRIHFKQVCATCPKRTPLLALLQWMWFDWPTIFIGDCRQGQTVRSTFTLWTGQPQKSRDTCHLHVAILMGCSLPRNILGLDFYRLKQV